MKCPHCKEKMEPSDSSGINTTTCFYCNGIWINPDEINELLTKEKDTFNIAQNQNEELNNNCPSCENIKLRVSNFKNTNFYYCPSCKGIFLKQGVIEKIFPNTYKSRTEIVNDKAKPLFKYFTAGFVGIAIAFLGSYLDKNNIFGGGFLFFIGFMTAFISILIFQVKIFALLFGKNHDT